MGIFSKISGVDAKLRKYKKRASNVLEIVRLQAKEDGHDFENIMFNSYDLPDDNQCIDQSLKLTMFLAGALAQSEENKELMHIKGWRLSIFGSAIEDVMLENNYHNWDLNWFLLEHPKNLDNSQTLLYLKRISYSHGGKLVSMGIDIDDDFHTKINISIFLDILEEEDGYYADFEAGPASVDRYKKIKNL